LTCLNFDALFSDVTYLVLRDYLAKEETQKTAHWCTVRATQSYYLQRSRLAFS